MTHPDAITLTMANGDNWQFKVAFTFTFEGTEYALLARITDSSDGEVESVIMQIQREGSLTRLVAIDDIIRLKRVSQYAEQIYNADDADSAISYQNLNRDQYDRAIFDKIDLGEGMTVVLQSMHGWWKQRVLLNHNTQRAYLLMDEDYTMKFATADDIDWSSLSSLPDKAITTAKRLSMIYPTHIRGFNNGVATIEWQLNPDGRYYADSDGYGMTDDQEITLYGYIDRNGRLVGKFRYYPDIKALAEARRQAEAAAKPPQPK